MKLKDKVEYYIKNYHFLYPHDINSVIRSLYTNYSKREELEKISDRQFENLLKFLDAMFFYIECNIFDGKGLKFVFENFDYLPTPSYQRVEIVTSLFDFYIMELPEVINNTILSERKLIALNEVPIIRNNKDKEAMEKRIVFFPELNDYFEKVLSELCYMNLKKLVSNQLWNFKKGSLKLYLKLSKLNKLENKIELFWLFKNSPIESRELLFRNYILQNYSFDDYDKGELWFKIYSDLEVSLL